MDKRLHTPRKEWPAGHYEGEMLDEQRHGYGTMRFFNGNTYSGQWLNDQFHGVGEYSWADGRTYKGQFDQDKIQGKGVAQWPDGRHYEGDWLADLADGHGILTIRDHRVYEGTFRNDFPVIGQMIEKNGTVFLANFDGSTHASEWHPCRKSKVGAFQDGWDDAQSPFWIREFAWDDGRCFAGSCIGYIPSNGVYLDVDGGLQYVVFDGKKTFAEGPSAILTRKLNWQVRFRLNFSRLFCRMLHMPLSISIRLPFLEIYFEIPDLNAACTGACCWGRRILEIC
jgi:hypothetical protein